MALFTKKPKRTQAPAQSQDLSSLAPANEQAIRKHGEELLDRARKHKAGLLSAKFYQDKLMDWSMKDHDFKVQLFRFVDAFPTLRTPDAVHQHLVDYLTQPGVSLPAGLGAGLKAGGAAKGLMTKTISGQIKGMAGNFIAGTDAASALPNLRKLWSDGIAFSVDLLGEACVSTAEAEMYKGKYLDLVGNLPGEVAGWKPNERLESDHLGAVPRTNVSIKISSLSAQTDPIDTEGAIADLMPRLEPILTLAKQKNVFINFDMEQFELKDLTLELFFRCCEKWDFDAGIAMQAYLKSGVEDAQRVADWARANNRVVSVRLVKGAYWDYETIHAEEQGWPCPVWNEKWQTDACFERMSDVFLDACPKTKQVGGVKLALGSHNARSIAYALAGLDARNLPRNAIELQMLHGMADQLKHAAAEMGLRVREYVPVGEMIPGMAYLVRRLLENTSNESWLKSGFLDGADADQLLRDPTAGRGAPKPDLYVEAKTRHNLSDAPAGVGDGQPFYTDPLRDFADPAQREAFADAVSNAVIPQIANDKTPEQAAEMVRIAEEAFPAWRDTDPVERANILVRAADAMRERRDELSGVIIKENGKSWRDADADVTEAIDFLEYYARESVALFDPERLGRFIGELDEVWHEPRGVAVVISPWNFPLAIAAGMTTAALVTGNTVVLKPAEQTPGIARILCDILWAAGTPHEVLHFCPAPGETTGVALVRDPRVDVLAFTGSKAVGLNIVAAAGVTPQSPEQVYPGPEPMDFAKLYPGSAFPQPHVKRVVCEMGGKNAIIIDTSADLDEAVVGVRQSAFGFQGQKCSACSRVIVVDPEGEEGEQFSLFMERFTEATRSLVVGDPTRPGTDVGPVIDQEAHDKIQGLIDKTISEGAQVALRMEIPDGLAERVGKPYVGPTILTNCGPGKTLWTEEAFGPVVAVTTAKDYDEAIKLALDNHYKLTGGVFTRRPEHIALAKRRFRVGNLYINRGITGALVGRQPFGGFGMSGIGSKAGGSEYLLQFVEPRACTENTMRRGFAPEL